MFQSINHHHDPGALALLEPVSEQWGAETHQLSHQQSVLLLRQWRSTKSRCLSPQDFASYREWDQSVNTVWESRAASATIHSTRRPIGCLCCPSTRTSPTSRGYRPPHNTASRLF